MMWVKENLKDGVEDIRVLQNLANIVVKLGFAKKMVYDHDYLEVDIEKKHMVKEYINIFIIDVNHTCIYDEIFIEEGTK